MYQLLKEIFIFVSFLTLIFVRTANAQYQMNVANGVLINSNTYEFEVFIRSMAGPFQLSSYQCSFTFNNNIINGGSISFSYIVGTSELVNPPSIGIGLNTSDGQQELTFASIPGSDNISTTERRVGRFRLQNSNPFGEGNTNIMWNFEGNITTILTGSDFTNITVPSNHISEDSPTPVELVSFTGEVLNNRVELKWSTASETNNKGFEIHRSKDGIDVVIGFIEGRGSSSEVNSYGFTDETELQPGIYSYRLKQIDYDGSFEYTSEVRVEMEEQVKDYSLLQNYPNPFNPTTKIRFQLPEDTEVELTVYNSIGEELTNLVKGRLTAGRHEIEFNAGNYSSGVYFYQLNAGNYSGIKKMIVTK